MSRLSDVVGQVIELEMGPDGCLDIGSAVSAAIPLLDEEDIDILAREALAKRITYASTRSKASISKTDTAQAVLPFPNIRSAHALDLDARVVKLTTELTEIEFRRLIEMRRKQIKNDTAYLKELQSAYTSVEPIWRISPDLTFGAVSEIYARGMLVA